MFNDQLLEDFAHNLYGYGNYSANYWFIGMEEGGGNSVADITSRLNAWNTRGRHELENMAEYHAEIGIYHLFGPHPKLQRTWGELIRILLSANGHLPTTDEVRKYQGLHLGRKSGDTCLLELLPLPSPSTNNWLYGQHSQLPYLTNRETYKQTFITPRITHLQDRITEHEPRAVIFYSHSYRRHWQEIAGIDLIFEKINTNEATAFVVTKHPAARGITYEYFHRVGRLIAAEAAHESSIQKAS